jgi:hypothetical protein
MSASHKSWMRSSGVGIRIMVDALKGRTHERNKLPAGAPAFFIIGFQQIKRRNHRPQLGELAPRLRNTDAAARTPGATTLKALMSTANVAPPSLVWR